MVLPTSGSKKKLYTHTECHTLSLYYNYYIIPYITKTVVRENNFHNLLRWVVLGLPMHFFNTIFVSSHMYPENPEGTQVIVGSMNMGYISDTARNRTHNLFRPKREPIPLGHSDGLWCIVWKISRQWIALINTAQPNQSNPYPKEFRRCNSA